MDRTGLARAVNGARLVVHRPELGVVVVWNGSATFNVVDETSGEALDVWTTYDVETAEAARQVIADHMEEWK